jgi:hypothetical protein
MTNHAVLTPTGRTIIGGYVDAVLDVYSPTEFNAIEVHGIDAYNEQCAGASDLDSTADYYAVFLHRIKGGLVCVGDFPTLRAAHLYANNLKKTSLGETILDGLFEVELGIPRPNVFGADSTQVNQQRTESAEEALRAFRVLTGVDEEDQLSDLLINLQHWAQQKNYDFSAALTKAKNFYLAERQA